MSEMKGGGVQADAPAKMRWTRAGIERLLADHGTAEGIARHLGLSGGTVRDAIKRHMGTASDGVSPPTGPPPPAVEGAEKVGVTLGRGVAVASLPPGADLGDLDALLRNRGLDPDEWIVERVTVNEWEALASGGGPDGEPKVVTLHQLKAHLLHRTNLVTAAVEVAVRHVPSPTATARSGGELVAVMGDQQAPYHDEELHQAVLRWLADVQPTRGVFTGDTLDLPTISRHRDRPGWSASTQECVNVGYRLLSDVRDANPETTWTKLRGNHDWRLESELMDRAERMFGLTPAVRPDEPPPVHLYSIRRLLHLDELGITLAGTEGDDWRYGEVALAPGLAVRHAPPSREKAARLARSVIAGHTHRQSIRNLTAFDTEGEPVVRTIVETGCLARTREGLGYAPDADWQAGFATVAIHPDGAHHFDLATWRNGVLTWRGERW